MRASFGMRHRHMQLVHRPAQQHTGLPVVQFCCCFACVQGAMDVG